MSTNSLKGGESIKIHFVMKKKVSFGQALYVVGNIPEIGCWRVRNSLRLTWNSDDYWSGSLRIPAEALKTIQFKYVIAFWDNPDSGVVEWEAGKHNRKINLQRNKNHIICENSWNMDKITLNLLVPNEQFTGEDYYVLGSSKQFGEWKKTNKMNSIPSTSTLPSSLEKLYYEDRRIFTASFQIYRGRKRIHYFYMKKSEKCQIERQPGRKVLLCGKSFHSRCLKIENLSGDMEIYEQCFFNQLNYSKITENIFLGSYLHTCEDFEKLKENGIDAVLSIQSEKDYAMHCLSPHYLEVLGKEYKIEVKMYSILDMDAEDFRKRCQGALSLMKRLIQQKKKVYVHCSAGMYRSPQIVLLYLVLHENYNLEKALKMVTERHAFARPNMQIINGIIRNVKKEKKEDQYRKIFSLN